MTHRLKIKHGGEWKAPIRVSKFRAPNTPIDLFGTYNSYSFTRSWQFHCLDHGCWSGFATPAAAADAGRRHWNEDHHPLHRTRRVSP